MYLGVRILLPVEPCQYLASAKSVLELLKPVVVCAKSQDEASVFSTRNLQVQAPPPSLPRPSVFLALRKKLAYCGPIALDL